MSSLKLWSQYQPRTQFFWKPKKQQQLVTESIYCKTTNKPDENWQVRETLLEVFLLTPWLIGIKYPKKIALCDINAVKLLTIVVIIDAQLIHILKKKKKKMKWGYQSKKIPCRGLVKFEIFALESYSTDSNTLKLFGVITMQKE